jgi:putative glutathione S-transferase
MGLLVEGVWHDKWYETKKHGGRFVRQESVFRHWITADGSSGFPAAANRYHLYVSYACPWAHRALIFRALKGLEDVISVDPVHWFMGGNGWEFDAEHPDRVNGAQFLYQNYVKAKPDYTGRVTVPTLWDTQQGTIVNNESAELIRMFNSEFNDLAKYPERDFYPADLRDEIDAVNERVYHTVNNGVYKSGFATTQAAYEEAVDALFDSLDWLEDRLSRQRYVAGDRLTEADIRLFTTLVRFDPVYVGHFKTNKYRIADYPNLWNHTREIYQLPGVKETVRMDHIKNHYYQSHETVNPTRIVPKGPVIDFDAPHDRDRFGGPGGLAAVAEAA